MLLQFEANSHDILKQLRGEPRVVLTRDRYIEDNFYDIGHVGKEVECTTTENTFDLTESQTKRNDALLRIFEKAIAKEEKAKASEKKGVLRRVQFAKKKKRRRRKEKLRKLLIRLFGSPLDRHDLDNPRRLKLILPKKTPAKTQTKRITDKELDTKTTTTSLPTSPADAANAQATQIHSDMETVEAPNADRERTVASLGSDIVDLTADDDQMTTIDFGAYQITLSKEYAADLQCEALNLSADIGEATASQRPRNEETPNPEKDRTKAPLTKSHSRLDLISRRDLEILPVTSQNDNRHAPKTTDRTESVVFIPIYPNEKTTTVVLTDSESQSSEDILPLESLLRELKKEQIEAELRQRTSTVKGSSPETNTNDEKLMPRPHTTEGGRPSLSTETTIKRTSAKRRSLDHPQDGVEEKRRRRRDDAPDEVSLVRLPSPQRTPDRRHSTPAETPNVEKAQSPRQRSTDDQQKNAEPCPSVQLDHVVPRRRQDSVDHRHNVVHQQSPQTRQRPDDQRASSSPQSSDRDSDNTTLHLLPVVRLNVDNQQKNAEQSSVNKQQDAIDCRQEHRADNRQSPVRRQQEEDKRQVQTTEAAQKSVDDQHQQMAQQNQWTPLQHCAVDAESNRAILVRQQQSLTMQLLKMHDKIQRAQNANQQQTNDGRLLSTGTNPAEASQLQSPPRRLVEARIAPLPPPVPQQMPPRQPHVTVMQPVSPRQPSVTVVQPVAPRQPNVTVAQPASLRLPYAVAPRNPSKLPYVALAHQSPQRHPNVAVAHQSPPRHPNVAVTALKSSPTHPNVVVTAHQSSPTHPNVVVTALQSPPRHPNVAVAHQSPPGHPNVAVTALQSSPRHPNVAVADQSPPRHPNVAVAQSPPNTTSTGTSSQHLQKIALMNAYYEQRLCHVQPHQTTATPPLPDLVRMAFDLPIKDLTVEELAKTIEPHVGTFLNWRIDFAAFAKKTRACFTSWDTKEKLTNFHDFDTATVTIFGKRFVDELSQVDVKNCDLGRLCVLTSGNLGVTAYRVVRVLFVLMRAARGRSISTPFIKRFWYAVQVAFAKMDEKCASANPFTMEDLTRLRHQIEQYHALAAWLSVKFRTNASDVPSVPKRRRKKKTPSTENVAPQAVADPPNSTVQYKNAQGICQVNVPNGKNNNSNQNRDAVATTDCFEQSICPIPCGYIARYRFAEVPPTTNADRNLMAEYFRKMYPNQTCNENASSPTNCQSAASNPAEDNVGEAQTCQRVAQEVQRSATAEQRPRTLSDGASGPREAQSSPSRGLRSDGTDEPNHAQHSNPGLVSPSREAAPARLESGAREEVRTYVDAPLQEEIELRLLLECQEAERSTAVDKDVSMSEASDEEASSTINHESRVLVDEVIDLTWIEDGDQMQILEEVIEYKTFKVEDDALSREVESPTDSGLGSPSPQADDDYKCLCGKRAIYVCACKSSMYCGAECQGRDWIYHQKWCSQPKS